MAQQIFNFSLQLPSPFMGDDENEDISIFLMKLEDVLNTVIEDEDELAEKLQTILPQRLSGAAYKVYRALPEAVKEDYDQTKQALLEAFNNQHKIRAFQNSITARKRLPGENIQVYLSDVTNLVQQAFPDYTPEQTRSEIFRRFLSGLDPKLRSKCVERGTQNVQEALECCKNYERAQYELNLASTTTQIASLSVDNQHPKAVSVSNPVVANLDSQDNSMTTDREVLESLINEIRQERKSNTQALQEVRKECQDLRSTIYDMRQNSRSSDPYDRSRNSYRRRDYYSPQRTYESRDRQTNPNSFRSYSGSRSRERYPFRSNSQPRYNNRSQSPYRDNGNRYNDRYDGRNRSRNNSYDRFQGNTPRDRRGSPYNTQPNQRNVTDDTWRNSRTNNSRSNSPHRNSYDQFRNNRSPSPRRVSFSDENRYHQYEPLRSQSPRRGANNSNRTEVNTVERGRSGQNTDMQENNTDFHDHDDYDDARHLCNISDDCRSQFIQTSIGHVPVASFVDTGSALSLIRIDLLSKIKAKGYPMHIQPADIDYVSSITGQQIRLLGKVTLPLNLENRELEHTFHIVPVQARMKRALLGLDFLAKHGISLDFKRGCVTYENKHLFFLCAHQLPYEPCEVRTSAPTNLPPNSDTIISANVCVNSSANPTDTIGLLEPQSLQDIETPIAIWEMKDNTIPVILRNGSDTEIHLTGDALIGTFYPIVGSVDDEFELIKFSDKNTVSSLETTDSETDLPPVDLSQSDLTREQKQEVESLLREFQDIFSKDEFDYGYTHLATHMIDTGDAKPVRTRCYPTSPAKKAEMERQCQELLDRGVIEYSSSPWMSSALLVAKKDGSKPRLVADLRKVNSVSKPSSFPLPIVQDTLDQLSGNSWFSTLDLSSGFWQIPLHPDDKEKTAFSTGSNLYQYRVMPMGLVGASNTFCFLMERVLGDLNGKCCVTYIDDIATMSKSYEAQLQHLREVFLRLREAGLKLRPQKCVLFQREIQFLGHTVNESGISPSPDNVQKVKDWPTPTNAKQVRSFLGLAGYYRRFIQAFSDIAQPLQALTQKDVTFAWTDACELAFQTLKTKLTTNPIVVYPDFTQPFTIQCDASSFAISGILSQQREGKDRVVAYFSQSLNATERKWATFDREMFAIVATVRKFRKYLQIQPFTIITDHKPLLGLKKLSFEADCTGRRTRWALELDTFTFQIIHKPGKSIANADALSRYPPTPDDENKHEIAAIIESTQPQLHSDSKQSCNPDLDQSKQPTPLTGNIGHTCNFPDQVAPVFIDEFHTQGHDILLGQQNDAGIQKVKLWKEQGVPNFIPHADPWTTELKTQFKKLQFHEGLLYRVCTLPSGQIRYQLVIPRKLISAVLHHFHGGPLVGHYSTDKVLEKVRTVCYWPKMAQDVAAHCKACPGCQANTAHVPGLKATLGTIEVTAPLQHVSIDITELPVTSKGNRYCLTVVDLFTRYVNLYPMKDQTAISVAKCLFEQYITEHGCPQKFHSDRGAVFDSHVFKYLCAHMEIETSMTSSYHPQGNSVVERYHRVLKSQLAKRLHGLGTEWDTILLQVQFSHNSAVHSSTGYSPFYLMHGREPILPYTVLFGTQNVYSSTNTPHAYIDDLEDRLQKAFSVTKERIHKSHAKQAKHYDQKARFTPYAEGDIVMKIDPRRTSKIAPQYLGPYKITYASPDGRVYQMIDMKNPIKRPQTVHYDKLKPYVMPNTVQTQTGDDTPPTPSSNVKSDSTLSSGTERSTQNDNYVTIRAASPTTPSASRSPSPTPSNTTEEESDRELPPSRAGRRRFRPARLADFILP